MASFTISQANSRWADGATVGAYPVSNWASWQLPPSGAAVGSATATAVVTAGSLVFTGLVNGVEYFAAKSDGVGGYWKIKPTAAPLAMLDRDNGQAGMIAIPVGVGRVAGALVANRGYAVRFVPSRDMAITLIAFAVTTAAAADDAVDCGIYNAAMGLIVSAGATAGKLNSLGVKTVTIATTVLRAGTIYYAAIAAGTFGGAAAALDMTSIPGVAASADVFGTTAGKREQAFMAAAHPLPATFTLGSITAVPVLWVRES